MRGERTFSPFVWEAVVLLGHLALFIATSTLASYHISVARHRVFATLTRYGDLLEQSEYLLSTMLRQGH